MKPGTFDVFPQTYTVPIFTADEVRCDRYSNRKLIFDAWVESVKGWFSQCHKRNGVLKSPTMA